MDIHIPIIIVYITGVVGLITVMAGVAWTINAVRFALACGFTGEEFIGHREAREVAAKYIEATR